MAVEVGILLISVILAPIVIYLVWSSNFYQQRSEGTVVSFDLVSPINVRRSMKLIDGSIF